MNGRPVGHVVGDVAAAAGVLWRRVAALVAVVLATLLWLVAGMSWWPPGAALAAGLLCGCWAGCCRAGCGDRCWGGGRGVLVSGWAWLLVAAGVVAEWTAPSTPRVAPTTSSATVNPVQAWATLANNLFALQRNTWANMAGFPGTRNTQDR